MKKTLTGLDFKIQEMAGRIRELREISGFSAQTMALKTGTSEEEYLRCEAGQSDLNFAFLYRCALAFGVDVTDLIEGSSPKLRSYTLTRAGNGQKIEQAHEMIYYNMASGFRNRIADPLFVENKYSDEAFYSDIELTSHVGQECDLVIRGSMKVQVADIPSFCMKATASTMTAPFRTAWLLRTVRIACSMRSCSAHRSRASRRPAATALP